jgi:hypothetical protein
MKGARYLLKSLALAAAYFAAVQLGSHSRPFTASFRSSGRRRGSLVALR